MMSQEPRVGRSPLDRHKSRTATAIWSAIGIALALGIVALVHEALLLFFAGVLLAVFLRALTRRLAGWTNLPESASLAIVLLFLTALGVGGLLFAAGPVSSQIQELLEQAPRSWDRLQDVVAQRLPDEGPLADAPQKLAEADSSRIVELMGTGFGAVTRALGAVGSGFVILILGIYLAADPPLYRRGAVRLLPLRYRGRAIQVLELAGEKLEGWILGTLISASIVGTLTWAGLWLLGIPMALILALIATVLTFVPNIGPLVSVVPAILVALGEGWAIAAAVLALYVVVQTIESYLITPVIQQHTVDLPPVVILVSQIAMGILFGVLGVAIAMPLAAVAMVAIQELWVKDQIEHRPVHEG
ncbi:AI-2E family transporter [Geminicoccus roseus]|uniref:AI-2E family transporter n=1 Tax=Geminicoccus roseus TaxID=404900 RepID=UPI00040FE58F|nr:AI-2E family transporter [Geminicoccus roseus]